LHDVVITQPKNQADGEPRLTMEATAKTYRYLEEDEIGEADQ